VPPKIPWQNPSRRRVCAGARAGMRSQEIQRTIADWVAGFTDFAQMSEFGKAAAGCVRGVFRVVAHVADFAISTVIRARARM
jgi:hypothetical protein